MPIIRLSAVRVWHKLLLLGLMGALGTVVERYLDRRRRTVEVGLHRSIVVVELSLPVPELAVPLASFTGLKTVFLADGRTTVLGIPILVEKPKAAVPVTGNKSATPKR